MSSMTTELITSAAAGTQDVTLSVPRMRARSSDKVLTTSAIDAPRKVIRLRSAAQR